MWDDLLLAQRHTLTGSLDWSQNRPIFLASNQIGSGLNTVFWVYRSRPVVHWAYNLHCTYCTTAVLNAVLISLIIVGPLTPLGYSSWLLLLVPATRLQFCTLIRQALHLSTKSVRDTESGAELAPLTCSAPTYFSQSPSDSAGKYLEGEKKGMWSWRHLVFQSNEQKKNTSLTKTPGKVPPRYTDILCHDIDIEKEREWSSGLFHV